MAAGIALGIDVDKLLNLYEACGSRIFPARIRNARKFAFISRGFFPMFLYPHEGKAGEGLGNVLREQLQPTASAKLASSYQPGNPVAIADIVKPVLLIPAYNTVKRRVDWFVSNNPTENSMWYDRTEVWKFCVCSASAPTFFSPYQLPTDSGEPETYIDGGVAVNNPALVAIAHAMFLPYKEDVEGCLKLDDISILSIGTGRSIEPFAYKDVKRWGLAQWAMRLNDLFIPAPNDVISSACWQMIRGEYPENAKRILRLDFDIKLDDPEDKKLQKIDDPTLFNRFVEVAQNYLSNPESKVYIDIGEYQVPKDAIHNFIRQNK
ncbi:MAG: hypothetical protein HC925_03395 [Coleofasciculaceae cyanobacterium SM2_3_26]|nr:hypothetical protein [Coleofasciculaceae cyanobacterium SM2_3_26]